MKVGLTERSLPLFRLGPPTCTSDVRASWCNCILEAIHRGYELYIEDTILQVPALLAILLRNVSVSIPTFSRTLKMKLRLLNFSVATFALAALFLPRHCVASGEAGPSRWAPSAPPERPHSQFARASRYKDKISPDRISELSSRFNPFPEIHPDADVPFYKNLPLYSVNAPPATVEQALRDYKTVGIIGEHDTVLLEYRVGRVDQGPMKEAAQARQVFNADERLHKVSKASIDVGTNIRRYERVDNLPHVDSIPILRPGTSSRRATDTPEQMLGAAKIAPKQFWLENSDGSHALVSPDGYNLQVRPPNADEQARIR